MDPRELRLRVEHFIKLSIEPKAWARCGINKAEAESWHGLGCMDRQAEAPVAQVEGVLK